MRPIDVVVVSYNSQEHLRACVEPLSRLPGVRVVVVDNASPDRSLATVDGLPVTTIQRRENGGFAVGCNAGWQAGVASLVLFLNPDATIDETSLQRLVAAMEARPDAGAVAPRILHPDGSLAYSLRRFPRVRSTFAQALFLHRVFRRSRFCDEVVKDAGAYARSWEPEWASGACLLVRRDLLEQLGGWDEEFFLYGEDVDLCARLRESGFVVRFEPEAVVVHHEGASAPRTDTLPLLAASRLQYAQKHFSATGALLERVGVALWALTHVLVSRGGIAGRRGHGRALRIAVTWRGTGARPRG